MWDAEDVNPSYEFETELNRLPSSECLEHLDLASDPDPEKGSRRGPVEGVVA